MSGLNILEYDKLSRIARSLERMEKGGGFNASREPSVSVAQYNEAVDRHNDLVRKLEDVNSHIAELNAHIAKLNAYMTQRDGEWKEVADSARKRSAFFEDRYKSEIAENEKLRRLLAPAAK
ncbi:hypothetical protein HLH33_10025 [Gluconacetobacter diazotrophicus]|uniref:Uncharacterized protein n=1 Tax=Gluconacetobacter diazotrophicus TaxID=33996 RepID=A0A7W4FFA2_GLUDI|nr:hypothetical protein [Gluconacetobacter diazotrophicus]MBB2156642.1 hypothetical protein [Gluconacetobacter diazotrophicus]